MSTKVLKLIALVAVFFWIVSCTQDQPDVEKIVNQLLESPTTKNREFIQKTIEENGIEIFLSTPEPMPILYAAALTNSRNIISQLSRNGYPMDVSSANKGNIVQDLVRRDYHYHLQTSREVASILKFLISEGADPDFIGPFGDTPLFEAILKDDVDLVKALLESGADPNIGNERVASSLLWARTQKADAEILRLLIENGADLSVRYLFPELTFCESLRNDYPNSYPQIFEEYCK